MAMTIKEVVRHTGMTVHTVRYYCDCGLVPNLKVDEHGNRLFDDDSLKWLDMAAFLRKSGMSIAEVREYFELCLQGDSTIAEREQVLLKLQTKAKEDLMAAKRRYEYLSEKTGHMKDILAGNCIDDSNPMNWRVGERCPE